MRIKAQLLLSAAVCLVLSGQPQAAPNQTVKVQFNLESQPLSDAVTEWAKQSGLQLIWPTGSLTRASQQAPKVSGLFSPDQALSMLLAGTGLTYSFVDEQTVAIRSAIAGAVSGHELHDQMRLARVDDRDASQGNQAHTEVANSANDVGRINKASEIVDEIVVTGSHIRGVPPLEIGRILIDRAEIDRSGYSRVEELLRSVPQNFGEIGPSGRFAIEGGSTLARLNDDQATGINLRGLGAQSTLTLLDGTRVAGSVGGRVVDISMVPLAMIERVDVLTGAHSAIYGADAVGGVANLVTRRDFSGAQTQLSYGSARDGGYRLQASQVLGMKHDRSGFALGYDYSKDQHFDLADAGLLTLSPNPGAGDILIQQYAQPDSRRHAGFASGRFELSDRIKLWGHGLISDKRFVDEQLNLLPNTTIPDRNRVEHPTRMVVATAGTDINVGSTWNLVLTGSSSATDQTYDISSFRNGSTVPRAELIRNDEADISSASAVADGVLPQMLGRSARIALGGEKRWEQFLRQDIVINGPPSSSNADRSRSVESLFAEIRIPVLERENGLLTRMELSAAGRYDDYSDFGSTFNPQFSAAWDLLQDISFTVGYAESFRAPGLSEVVGVNTNTLRFVTDSSSPSGRTPLFTQLGNRVELGPEEAKSWSFGLQWKPEAFEGTSLTLSYFDIEYHDRIEVPASATVDQVEALNRESRYPGLIDRSPAQSDLDQILLGPGRFVNLTGTAFGSCPPAGVCVPSASGILGAFPTVAIFDDRTNNIAVDKVRGLDLMISGRFATGRGDVTLGLNSTYTIDHARSVTATSPSFSLINEIGKPVGLRARGSVGWTLKAFSASAFVNYVDDYSNPYSAPQSAMPSWTTFDLTFQASGSAFGEKLLRGTTLVLSIQNLFDREPPRFASSNIGVLYDSVNADPFGRFITLRLGKSW